MLHLMIFELTLNFLPSAASRPKFYLFSEITCNKWISTRLPSDFTDALAMNECHESVQM